MRLGCLSKKWLRKLLGKTYYQHYRHYIQNNQVLNGKYGSLRFIAEYSSQIFKEVKNYNDNKNIEVLRNKSIINVGFVTYTSTTWNVDQLCKLLNENEKFHVDIIVGHRPVDKEFTEKEYRDAISYFSALGYSTIQASDIEEISNYDILFCLDPGPLKEKNINLFNLPLKIMILHTSYSFMLAGNKEKIGAWMYHLSYKYYTDSIFYKKEIEKYKYSTNNVEFFGFPKMDQYYFVDFIKRTNKKIIIYAPHHSVNYSRYKSATFNDNYLTMLELAKKYSETTFWIYKPHPLLRDSSVHANIFSDIDEYDNYENQWRLLSNADVVSVGDYFPIFKESDGMITDSVSFLAEYQFTHKPLLLLQSGLEEYNEFGESIVEILYKCSGTDKSSIEKFILDCINDYDSMFDQRKMFFDQNLNYLKNGETANVKIYNQILGILE